MSEPNEPEDYEFNPETDVCDRGTTVDVSITKERSDYASDSEETACSDE